MILYPAIDLKNGQCVRLLRGDMNAATVFSDSPAAQAKTFAGLGFRWLHVVDLDGAVSGRSANATVVSEILKNVSLPVQLGGGIRDRAAIEHWLEAGVARVILGTIAVRDPQLVRDAARAFPGKIAVGIDAKGGHVAVEGWVSDSGVAARELARRFEDAGVACIVYTDISRDGTGTGLNIDETAGVADAVSVPVIASGGIGSLDDLRALKARAHPNIAGAICGRALYEGRIDARAALALTGEAA